MKVPSGIILCLTPCATAIPARADDLTVTMRKLTRGGTADALGTIVIDDSAAGATFKLNLPSPPPGYRDFHGHENDDCGPILMNGVRSPGAGGHWDPDATGKHEGPAREGHLGDLPVLDVAANGTASQTLTAPPIKDVDALKKHALIIHAGGDNDSDLPNPSGGDGARIARGEIK